MGDTDFAHRLLGTRAQRQLILLFGPNYPAMQALAAAAGITTRDLHPALNARTLLSDALHDREKIALSGASIALLASTPEVEGILDLSATGPHLTEVAYMVDRAVYCGSHIDIRVHPRQPGTAVYLRNGQFCATPSTSSAIAPAASSL